MLSNQITAHQLDQGVRLAGRGRLREQSGGLVDDNELGILIKDIQSWCSCA
jgi:hypothetical protein